MAHRGQAQNKKSSKKRPEATPHVGRVPPGPNPLLEDAASRPKKRALAPDVALGASSQNRDASLSYKRIERLLPDPITITRHKSQVLRPRGEAGRSAGSGRGFQLKDALELPEHEYLLCQSVVRKVVLAVLGPVQEKWGPASLELKRGEEHRSLIKRSIFRCIPDFVAGYEDGWPWEVLAAACISSARLLLERQRAMARIAERTRGGRSRVQNETAGRASQGAGSSRSSQSTRLPQRTRKNNGMHPVADMLYPLRLLYMLPN
ncbi:hypothetical protein DL93DRAFT_1321469 [Clavulina sp. PMI_390]|nr:hypothetical protein DL93DRAFT_1321469 [Clavulina sp. PMI_390]